MYRKNVASQHLGFTLVSAADGSAITTGTVTGRRVVDNGTQATVGGTISHKGNGQWNLALAQADTNGDYISFLFTHASAIPVEKSIVTTAANPSDAVRFGLTALPNATPGTATGLPIQIGLQKNTAVNNFPFLMVDNVDHITGKTGLTVTSQRSIDGGAFANTTNTPVEIAHGLYRLNLSAADLNGETVVFRLTATGADPTVLTVRTTT